MEAPSWNRKPDNLATPPNLQNYLRRSLRVKFRAFVKASFVIGGIGTPIDMSLPTHDSRWEAMGSDIDGEGLRVPGVGEPKECGWQEIAAILHLESVPGT
ncbi:unnamed protein product [Symbiodinium sp. KB8]|nr:unnamed protein product [Symbiodinium sp. KB8]